MDHFVVMMATFVEVVFARVVLAVTGALSTMCHGGGDRLNRDSGGP